jgi:cation diffusion facilitator family transporter
VWTSLGAVVGLVLAMWTGQLWIDPVMAIFFGANILYTGAGLMRLSVNGLMDTADPVIEARAREIITAFCASHQCSFHRLRVRLGGNVAHLDFHLQLDDMMPMQEAHTLATQLEDLIRQEFGPATEVFTHLESMTQPDGHI